MAVITIGHRTITYPTAKDLGLTVGAETEPTIISQHRTAHAVVNLRLSLEGEPTVIAEHTNLRTKETTFADVPANLVDQLFKAARQRHAVGIMQAHLASELAYLIRKGEFSLEQPRSSKKARAA